MLQNRLDFTFKSPPKSKGPHMKKLQVHKLCDPRVKNNLQVMFEERLHCVTAAEPEEQWKQVKAILQKTTAEVVGILTRKHQDWFDKADKEIQELLEKKCSYHNGNHLLAKPDDQAAKAAYKTACSTLQAKLRTMYLCRMICGQDLPRGHNGMLTLVTLTCAHSTRQ